MKFTPLPLFITLSLASLGHQNVPKTATFDVILKDDLSHLTQSNPIELASLKSLVASKGLQIVPQFPKLEAYRARLLSRDVDSGVIFPNSGISRVNNVLISNKLHQFYRISGPMGRITGEMGLLDAQMEAAEALGVESIVESLAMSPLVEQVEWVSEDEKDLMNTNNMDRSVGPEDVEEGIMRVEVDAVEDGGSGSRSLRGPPGKKEFKSVAKQYDTCESYPCQGYLYGSDQLEEYLMPGVNAVAAWNLTGNGGEGVNIIVQEQGLIDHLPSKEFEAPIAVEADEYDVIAHKTSVAGIILSKKDEYGTTGIAHNADGYIDLTWTSDGPDGVNYYENVYEHVRPGDVLVGSWHRSPSSSAMTAITAQDPACVDFGCYFPSILGSQSLNASLSAFIDMGVAVFMCVGNGNVNLSTPYWKELMKQQSFTQKVALVTGFDPRTGTPLESSSYTETTGDDEISIDFIGWGAKVVSTTVDGNYTTSFSGCSSATPIVAGAAALIQSNAKQLLGAPLPVADLIKLMKETGRKVEYQIDDSNRMKDFSSSRIPDVEAAVKQLMRMAGNGEDNTVTSNTTLSTTTATNTTEKTSATTSTTSGSSSTTTSTSIATTSLSTATTTSTTTTAGHSDNAEECQGHPQYDSESVYLISCTTVCFEGQLYRNQWYAGAYMSPAISYSPWRPLGCYDDACPV